MPRTTHLTPALLALATLLAGCLGAVTSDVPLESSSAPRPRTLEVIAGDHYLESEPVVDAGLVEVTLRNTGAELHHVIFYRLDEGRTFAEFRDAFLAGRSATPDFATAYGGPNVALPGGSQTAYLDLEPGEYVLACAIPTQSDGVMHAAKGMMAPLTVRASDAPKAQPPAPDATARLSDFRFDLDAPLRAGDQTLRIVNEGSVSHELVLFELFGDATPMELLHAIEDPNATAPPPGRPVGGVTPLSPGKEATIPLSLTPGRYFLVCFDVTGTGHVGPHFLSGMLQEMEVA